VQVGSELAAWSNREAINARMVRRDICGAMLNRLLMVENQGRGEWRLEPVLCGCKLNSYC